MWFFHFINASTRDPERFDFWHLLSHTYPTPQLVFRPYACTYPSESSKGLSLLWCFSTSYDALASIPFWAKENLILLAHCDWNALNNLSSTSFNNFPRFMADRLRKVVLLSNHIMCNFICLHGKLEKITGNCCTDSVFSKKWCDLVWFSCIQHSINWWTKLIAQS